MPPPPTSSLLRRVSFPLETARLRLEPPSLSRVREYIPLVGDRHVSRWLLHVPWPYRPADARSYIAEARRKRRLGEGLSLAVIESATNRLVGGVGLSPLNWAHHNAELGYWIGRRFWRQGYATEAVGATVEMAFRDLRMHRLEACIFPGNDRSAHVLRKLGFRRESVRREALFLRGRWTDDIVFALVVDDYRPRRLDRPP